LGFSNFPIIGSIGQISTIVLAYIFLDERLSLIQFIGAIIVLVGIGIISISKIKEKVIS
jgi:drug/metabolite transporter (DMT)-like permease